MRGHSGNRKWNGHHLGVLKVYPLGKILPKLKINIRKKMGEQKTCLSVFVMEVQARPHPSVSV